MLFPKKLIILVQAILIGLFGLYPFYLPKQEKAGAYGIFDLAEKQIQELSIIQSSTLLPFSNIASKKTAKKMNVIATAYSPSIEETDDTPFITASGSFVRDGIIANNMLPFGTKVRFPKLFGAKIFTVEDRMHWRLGYNNVDLFFFSKQQALEFGARYTEMEILN